MIYETKIQFTVGDKITKQRYIVEEAESFGDAESQTCEYCAGEADTEVTDVKRSRIKEIVNVRTCADELLWMAELQDVFHTDEGEEKELRYKVVVFAKTFDSAKARMAEYMKMGYDMTLVSLKVTKFEDII